jgi:alpha-galactosidase
MWPNNIAPYRADDVAGYRQAPGNVGSDIVIMASPRRGPDAKRVEGLLTNFGSARLSADVWDKWSDVKKLFQPAADYASLSTDSSFADLDMLPFGTLTTSTTAAPRASLLTRHQMFISMNLHLIARSSIMMGGQLTDIPSREFHRPDLGSRLGPWRTEHA